MYERAPYQPIETQICEAHGLWIKQIVVPKALTYIPQHAHELSHVTLLAVGAIEWWADGEPQGLAYAPKPLHIPAGVKHTFKTLVDGVTLYCVHELTSPQALKVLEHHELIG